MTLRQLDKITEDATKEIMGLEFMIEALAC